MDICVSLINILHVIANTLSLLYDVFLYIIRFVHRINYRNDALFMLYVGSLLPQKIISTSEREI